MRRELLASHQLLNESMTAEGLQLVEPAVIFRPKLIVTAQDSGSASSSVRLTVSCEPTSIRTPEPSTQLQGGSETHGLEMSRALQASQVADQLLADLQEPVELPPQPTPVSPSPEPQPQPGIAISPALYNISIPISAAVWSKKTSVCCCFDAWCSRAGAGAWAYACGTSWSRVEW